MSTMLRSGETLAGYRIDQVLGSGGMGVVYRATQLSLGRDVALKVLAPHLSADPEFRERFRREAALQARLEHPHVVTVYEAGESEEGLFLALRLVDGTDLRRLIESGELGAARALALLEQVASALDAAHEQGLVHRDVKPQNVLVDGRDHAYLADFGLTRSSGSRVLTQTGTYLGSLDYVAPELVRGEPFTAASDLYAYAAVLYESVAGDVPFPRDTEAALLYAHLSEPPPRLSERRPELPAALDAVLARGLAKDPGDRYANAGELARAAREALERTVAAIAEGPAAAGAPAPAGSAARGFGETIADGALLRRAPVVAVEPERGRPAAYAIAAVVVLCAGLAAVGAILGRALGGGVERSPQGIAVGGPIVLTFPTAHWRPARPRALAGLDVRSPIALAPRHGRGLLEAGVVPTVDARTLMPPAVAKRAGPGARVRLGPYEALRYRRARFVLYAVPVGRGAALVACRAGGEAAAQTLARCESVAATIALRGVETAVVGADPAFAATLRLLVRRLDGTRIAERRALGHGRTPFERAGHADVLASAYASAAAQLQSTAAPVRERSTQRRVLRALGGARDGYVSLSAALRVGDRNAYVRAAKEIRAAEAAANGALRALAALGYAVTTPG